MDISSARNFIVLRVTHLNFNFLISKIMFCSSAACLNIIIWVFFCSLDADCPVRNISPSEAPHVFYHPLAEMLLVFPKHCCYGLDCLFLSTICKLIFCGNLYGFQVRIQLNRPAYLVFRRKESNRSISILVHSPFPPTFSHCTLTWRYSCSFEMELNFQAVQLNFSQKFHLPECSQY